MAHSKAKLKSSGNKTFPYFRPLKVGNASDKCVTNLAVGRSPV